MDELNTWIVIKKKQSSLFPLFWPILCPSLPPVNLCSNPEDKLQIYRDNFEKAYLDSTERFYRTQAPSYLQQNGVQNYMKYVSHNIIDYYK